MDRAALRDVGNSAGAQPTGEAPSMKTFQRQRRQPASCKANSSAPSDDSGASAHTAAATPGGPTATPGAATATPLSISDFQPHGDTPAGAATPPDTPSSEASSGAEWTPGGDGSDSGGEGAAAAAVAATPAQASAAWRAARRRAAAARPRRSSILSGAALPGGAAWRREAPGTRLLQQRWRGRGLSKAKREALEEYLSHMAAHFAEVDAFELIEEDEDTAPSPMPPQSAAAHTTGRAATTGPRSSRHAASVLPPRPAAGDSRRRTATTVAPTPAAVAATPLPLAVAAAAGGQSVAPASGELMSATPEGPGTATGTQGRPSTRSMRRGASLVASTPADSQGRGSLASSEALTSDTPVSSSTVSPPGSLLANTQPRTAGGTDMRRSSVAHGLLRRQTLLPAADAGAAPASGAAQLRARQRMSSLSMLPPLPLPAARASGRPSELRRSSLLPSAAGRRSSSLATSVAAAAAARRSSARDSLAGPLAGRQSAATGKASLAAGAAAGRLLPGAVLEEGDEEAVAAAEEEEETQALAAAAAAAAEKLGARLSAKLRLSDAVAEGDQGEDEEEEDEEEETALEGVAEEEEEEDVIEEEEEEEEEAGPAEPLSPLQQLLSVCGQGTDVDGIPSMAGLLGGMLDLKRIVKLGEGTYGEVFRAPLSGAYLDALEDEGSDVSPPESLVVKIIPMEGEIWINDAPQKGAGDLMAEAVIALALSGLRTAEGAEGERLHSVTSAFVRTCHAGVCRGPYPQPLIKAWRTWDKSHGSENDAVEGLPSDQLYCVLAMEEAGRDLEAYRLSGFHQARSVLLQVALALAVGEEALGFEHRDLHWGNVLLRAAPSLTTSCRLRGMDISVQTQGVLATLIDFTASRLQTPGGDVAFCDLSADPELFQGPRGNCQADTYRRMLKATRGEWSAPCPITNALWLHYMAETVLTSKAPPAGWSPSEKRALRDFRRRAAGYASAGEAIWDELFEGLWVCAAQS